MNTIAIWQTGTPFHVTAGTTYPAGDYNADGTDNDRPDAPGFGSDLGSPSRDHWLNGVFTVDDFPRPAVGTVGSLGRNAFRGPDYFNVDFSLFKNFDVAWMGSQPATLQVRLETYNLFNRVNLDDPNSNLSSGLFGRSTSARPSREIQVGVKFIF